MKKKTDRSGDGTSQAKDFGPEAEEVRALTNQFYITLRGLISKVEEDSTTQPQAALTRVHEILDKRDDQLTWADAYDVEQQLVHLFDANTLETELKRRLVEAQSGLQPPLAQWYEDRERELTDLGERRALLLRLVNDLQWRYTKDEARRGYTKQITSRTEWVFGGTVLVFLGLALWVLLKEVSRDHVMLIIFAGAAGAWGAAFSMMTSLRQRMAESSFEDLKLNRSWGLILARVMVGLGAALILYFFVRAKLLEGGLFPSLADSGSGEVREPIPGTEFAKLMIWCFLAGFSEKLVPNILARTEGQAVEQPQTLPHEPKLSVQSRAKSPVTEGNNNGYMPANASDQRNDAKVDR